MRTRVSFVVQNANLEEKKQFFDFWKDQAGINLIVFQGLLDINFFEQPDQDWELSEKNSKKSTVLRNPIFAASLGRLLSLT